MMMLLMMMKKKMMIRKNTYYTLRAHTLCVHHHHLHHHHHSPITSSFTNHIAVQHYHSPFTSLWLDYLSITGNNNNNNHIIIHQSPSLFTIVAFQCRTKIFLCFESIKYFWPILEFHDPAGALVFFGKISRRLLGSFIRSFVQSHHLISI